MNKRKKKDQPEGVKIRGQGPKKTTTQRRQNNRPKLENRVMVGPSVVSFRRLNHNQAFPAILSEKKATSLVGDEENSKSVTHATLDRTKKKCDGGNGGEEGKKRVRVRYFGNREGRQQRVLPSREGKGVGKTVKTPSNQPKNKGKGDVMKGDRDPRPGPTVF